MKWMSLIFLVTIFGCSSSPTRYEASASGKNGYSDKAIDSNLKLATFLGNSSTKKENAELYAKFRAIEICSETNAYAHILLVKDKTFQKEISQTTTNYPSYSYYGASPYYGRYGGYGTGVGYGAVSTNTWNESYTYPLFEVYFECSAKPMDARVSFNVLSQSQMKDFINDLKGAVQIEAILPDSPNKNQFKVADIITHANGSRIDSILELYQASRNAVGKKFVVNYIREGNKKMAEVKFLDVTDLVAHSQREILKAACKIDELKNRPLCK